jgi:hypothetical protein
MTIGITTGKMPVTVATKLSTVVVGTNVPQSIKDAGVDMISFSFLEFR